MGRDIGVFSRWVRRCILTACLLASVAVGNSALTETALVRPVTLNDLTTDPGCLTRSLAVSPDGRRLAVENAKQLLMLDLKNGQTQQDLGEGLMPAWSRSGNRLAFYSSRSGSLQIWVWDAETDQVEQLTTLPGGVDPDPTTRIEGYTADGLSMSLSPDGTAIAFASRVLPASPTRQGPLVLDDFSPPKLTLAGVFANSGRNSGAAQIADGRTWGYRYARPGESLVSQIFVVNIETHELRQLTHGVATFFHPAWSPDGRYIAVSTVSSPSLIEELEAAVTQTDHQWRSSILTIDVLTGAQRNVAGDDDLKYYPRWSPDGSKLAFIGSTGLYTKPTIRVVDLDDNKVVTAGPELRIWDFAWTNHKDRFLVSFEQSGMHFAYASSGSRTLSPLDLATARSVDVVGGPNRWTQAADGSLAWLHDSQLWYLQVGRPTPTLLRDFNERDRGLSWGRVETIKWRNGGGDYTAGELLYPPGYQARKQYPMIVDAYPLPGNGGWNTAWGGNQAWASLGYVVFKPTPRAPFYGNINCSNSAAHCNAAHGRRGWQQGIDDLMSGVDYMVQKGIADPARICLYGHSNGGGFASYLVTQTHRFKCAVVVAPATTDLVRPALLNTDGGSIAAWVDGLTVENNIDVYVSMSSVFHLHHVTTPMLIAVGDKDGEFLLNAIEIYNGVRRAGSEVTLVRYPEQGHLITGDALRDLWAREIGFFGRFLHPTPSQ